MLNSLYKLLFFYFVIFFSFNKIFAFGFANKAPTFYLKTLFGLGTYKSTLVESNDTNTGLMFEIGGNAGRYKNIGFLLRNEITSTNFELNNSSNSVIWQDVVIRYQFSYFYAGLLTTSINYQVNKSGTDTIDSTGYGYGGNAGIMFPLTNHNFLFLDINYASITKIVDKNISNFGVNSRMDINLGTYLSIMKDFLDFIAGYRQQNYAITTTSSYTESFLLTYFGLQMYSEF